MVITSQSICGLILSLILLGEGQVDGSELGNNDRTKYFALSFGMPVSRYQSVKLTYVNADTNVVIGSSSDSLILG